MLKKISDLGKSISNNEQKIIKGGTGLSTIDGGASFPCYCNGAFVGNASTVQGCIDLCPC